ncbi:hypothetical protein AA313_de0209929 [Arthrobotrys entomopaga]|nr:hypothetical protein AA313_de0209929 [Arthrobotrys entomopaga]
MPCSGTIYKYLRTHGGLGARAEKIDLRTENERAVQVQRYSDAQILGDAGAIVPLRDTGGPEKSTVDTPINTNITPSIINRYREVNKITPPTRAKLPHLKFRLFF